MGEGCLAEMRIPLSLYAVSGYKTDVKKATSGLFRLFLKKKRFFFGIFIGLFV